jgi:uncharacterized protein (TIGR03067 family)
MLATADTSDVILLQRLGAARDARREASVEEIWKMSLVRSGAWILLLLSICTSPPHGAIGQASSDLIGKWKVVSFQGKEGDAPGSLEFFKDGRVLISQDGSEPKEGTYVTDETKSPFIIILKMSVIEAGNQKKTTVICPGIYKIAGGMLILKAVNADGVEPPKDFKVEPNGYAHLELVRDG